MFMNPNYFSDTNAYPGHTVFRCNSCPFDTFVEKDMFRHAEQNHQPLKLPEMDIDLPSWVESKRSAPAYPIRVGIGLLTWNNGTAPGCKHPPCFFTAGAIVSEVLRLKIVGIKTQVVWCDNGSTDCTKTEVSRKFSELENLRTLRFRENMGQCYSRNRMIEVLLAANIDYMIMVDGDIEMIPWSAFALAQFMHLRPPDNRIGCLGMYALNCHHELDNQAETCRRIDPWMVKDLPRIAWTQYGIFDMKMFREGLRFDESPAFMGPGWGLDDDDLFMSMTHMGYYAVNTPYFRYWHRRRGSSIKEIGEDATEKHFDIRRRYLMSKWDGIASVADDLRMLPTLRVPKLNY